MGSFGLAALGEASFACSSATRGLTEVAAAAAAGDATLLELLAPSASSRIGMAAVPGEVGYAANIGIESLAVDFCDFGDVRLLGESTDSASIVTVTAPSDDIATGPAVAEGEVCLLFGDFLGELSAAISTLSRRGSFSGLAFGERFAPSLGDGGFGD